VQRRVVRSFRLRRRILAFVDPAHDVAVGVIFNGVVGHESACLRRCALVRSLYADLAGGAPAADPEPAAPTRRRRRKH
jgi:hypothetical protein